MELAKQFASNDENVKEKTIEVSNDYITQPLKTKCDMRFQKFLPEILK